jgi:hypothetical protein
VGINHLFFFSHLEINQLTKHFVIIWTLDNTEFNIKHCSLTLIFIPNCKILLMCPSELIIIKITLYLMIYITVVVSRILFAQHFCKHVKHFCTRILFPSNLLTMRVHDEGYSRNTTCAIHRYNGRKIVVIRSRNQSGFLQI